jgi:hypothetical protein
MSIALSIGNNLTTNGVFTADAVNNTSVTNVTDFASVPGGGALKLLSTQTASASATIDFTSGIDSTYDSYVFKFYDIHPATDNVLFQFNLSTDSGSNYNVTKTTTHFSAVHNEADDAASLGYKTGLDLAQSTSFQTLVEEVGADNDQCLSGYLQLFNPSSTTFVKHFTARCNNYRRSNYSADHYTAGYGNTTSAVDAIQFKMSSGNIDAGQILLFGVN